MNLSYEIIILKSLVFRLLLLILTMLFVSSCSYDKQNDNKNNTPTPIIEKSIKGNPVSSPIKANNSLPIPTTKTTTKEQTVVVKKPTVLSIKPPVKNLLADEPTTTTDNTVPAITSDETLPSTTSDETLPSTTSDETVPATTTDNTVPAITSDETLPVPTTNETVSATIEVQIDSVPSIANYIFIPHGVIEKRGNDFIAVPSDSTTVTGSFGFKRRVQLNNDIIYRLKRPNRHLNKPRTPIGCFKPQNLSNSRELILSNLKKDTDEAPIFKVLSCEKLDATRSKIPVVIIGTNVAGITAAVSLHEKGYRNITIYEENGYIGERSFKYQHLGQTYNFGILRVPDNPSITTLARKVGFKLRKKNKIDKLPLVFTKGINDQTSSLSLMKDCKNCNFSSINYALARFNLWNLSFDHTNNNSLEPGSTDFVGDLSLPISKYAEINGFQAYLNSEPLVLAMALRGYVNFREMPALYALKLIESFNNSITTTAIIDDNFDHYQKLWEEVVESYGLKVKLNSRVTNISRKSTSDDGFDIYVTANGITEVYHKLIVATDLKTSLDYLDHSSEEYDIFTKVRYHYRTVTLFSANNLLSHAYLLKQTLTRSSIGQPITIYPDPLRRLFVSYQVAKKEPSSQDNLQLIKALKSSVDSLVGHFRYIVVQKHWRYFPHFTYQDITEGIYKRISQLQGQLSTYYVGGAMQLNTAEHNSRFSRYLINKHF